MMLAVALTLDVIWFNRNQVAHGQAPATPESLIQDVHRRYHGHKKAWSSKLGHQMKSWIPLDVGQLKVNYDVAVYNGILVFAAIIRNSQGQVIQAQSGKAEKGRRGLPVWRVLVRTVLMGYRLLLKMDCLDLVTQVHDRDSLSDWEIAGEVETIRGLLDTHHDWRFIWIPREGNAPTHNLARWCAREQVAGFIRPEILPIDVLSDDYATASGVLASQ